MTYSIGEVAALTGVSTVTLRAWESRYGVVRPQRTASSYRQYDDRDLAVLQRMHALVASGVSPRRAAALATGEAAAAPAPDTATALPALQDPTALARAGAALDGEALRRTLDEAFAVASIETAIDDWLLPSMSEVGRRWASGELDVVSEHFISAAVMRKLSALFEATPAHGPRVAVGLPNEARHELPALAFALLLQRAGAQVLYVGADIPQSCWSRLVETWQPQAAVLGVAADRDVAPAAAAVEALTAAGVAPVYVGGRAAPQVRGAIPLTVSLREAARTVAAALAHRGRSRQPQLAH
ncbi:MerR family transcriptional regulator [Flexivirga sp.]|uniref:MerR family transcriptional regulator n=1 Tax=Flexivirga sp. TaxID=1962927 RepID=UPI003F7F5D9A